MLAAFYLGVVCFLQDEVDICTARHIETQDCTLVPNSLLDNFNLSLLRQLLIRQIDYNIQIEEHQKRPLI